MDWISIILSILTFVGILYVAFSKKYAEKLAELLYQRDMAYEAEKGKNLATKEDVEELTQKVEAVKAEVNYEAARKHAAIERMEQWLIDLAYHAERINTMWNNAVIHSKDYESPNTLMTFVDNINDSLLQMRHLGNLIITTTDTEKTDLVPVVNMTDKYFVYGAELSARIQNIYAGLSSVQTINKFDTDLVAYSNTRKTVCATIDGILAAPSTRVTKEEAKKVLSDYIVWLHNQYFRNFHLVGIE